jgi:hypothetical protein
MTRPDAVSRETAVREELAAMRKLVIALEPLDVDAQARVVAWLWDRYVRPTIDESTDVLERPGG